MDEAEETVAVSRAGRSLRETARDYLDKNRVSLDQVHTVEYESEAEGVDWEVYQRFSSGHTWYAGYTATGVEVDPELAQDALSRYQKTFSTTIEWSSEDSEERDVTVYVRDGVLFNKYHNSNIPERMSAEDASVLTEVMDTLSVPYREEGGKLEIREKQLGRGLSLASIVDAYEILQEHDRDPRVKQDRCTFSSDELWVSPKHPSSSDLEQTEDWLEEQFGLPAEWEMEYGLRNRGSTSTVIE